MANPLACAAANASLDLFEQGGWRADVARIEQALREGLAPCRDRPGVVPDIVTLSKALTGGTLPLSAAIATTRVFDAFWSDDPGAALMHGPTYMANPLACAAANASLDLFATGDWRADVARIEAGLREGLAPCRAAAGVVDVRVKGAIGVVEFAEPVAVGALSQRFAELGVWIRPMGKVIYLTPPYVITDGELEKLTRAVRTVLDV
jgi:adenosylmethionine-8-amino-7-oxononanoate aminotransferase